MFLGAGGAAKSHRCSYTPVRLLWGPLLLYVRRFFVEACTSPPFVAHLPWDSREAFDVLVQRYGTTPQ